MGAPVHHQRISSHPGCWSTSLISMVHCSSTHPYLYSAQETAAAQSKWTLSYLLPLKEELEEEEPGSWKQTRDSDIHELC